MWNDAFVSFWHIWDHDNVSVEPDEVPPNIYFVDSQDTMSWAQGINFLLVHVKNLYSCEYFFTHDDDLSFKVKNVSDSRPLASVLTSILLDYQPAVAGFPWIFGEKTYAGMKDLAAFQQLHPIVNVLTGFDSGMLLFHKSVVDFFIPYSPRGEGAFTGNWSLCAHFINLFAPLTFKENAIRINAIEYENLVSISNVPKNKRKKLVLKVDEDGLALNAESRHPYEYRFNRPYMRFLTGGLLNHNQRWGREMMQRDITWEVKPISRGWNVDEVKQGYKKHRHFDKWNVLTRISEFYDISYPALSRNAWIRDKFNQEQLLDFVESRQQKGRDFSFTLHLFTTARDLTTFSLLWASLNTGNRISSPVKIYIHVDNQEVLSEKSTFISNIRKLRKLKCIHGTVSLRISSRRKGLIQTIMDAWSSMASEEIGILLPNETTILSRHFLEYAQQTTRQYLLSPSHHPTVMGYPPSTGFIVSPTYWTAFVAWFARLPAAFEPVLYDSPDINVWDARLRWDKFLARYLVERGLAFVVPRFPGDRTLVAEQIDTAQLVELTDASVEDKDGFWKGLSERGKDGKSHGTYPIRCLHKSR
ncbi:hypothetical protein BC830DRAFT_326622 [Chytriomyces sp. MP71]|nr:hypothetical protein BC830DRAFT_326622 [Chytriomyces sp. MP71]